jgi:hypothetical protein
MPVISSKRKPAEQFSDQDNPLAQWQQAKSAYPTKENPLNETTEEAKARKEARTSGGGEQIPALGKEHGKMLSKRITFH